MSVTQKHHTVGNSSIWKLDFHKWLLPGETLLTAGAVSSSATLTVDTVSVVLGKEVWFYTHGGLLGEIATVTVTVTTTKTQTKIVGVDYLVTAP